MTFLRPCSSSIIGDNIVTRDAKEKNTVRNNANSVKDIHDCTHVRTPGALDVRSIGAKEESLGQLSGGR